ncbi:Outer membrane efflux protein [Rubripirellula amarantea]|uniref:Outer membrane efflux protein n=1 Tax=Rubripirellula amarantea TaxID=2527999 RepID=A0A5C5WJ78_9BACT|nr:TolC family protein [Rubripirellula amarantea]TWT50165.1 Outer membrane efflux protein [Rubripirellula amarantea]
MKSPFPRIVTPTNRKRNQGIVVAVAAALWVLGSTNGFQIATAQEFEPLHVPSIDAPGPGNTFPIGDEYESPIASEIYIEPFVAASPDDEMQWWRSEVNTSVLDHPHWVSFGLDTVLLDTLEHSPRIQIVAGDVSVSLERIVQQDAAFDSSVLFDTRGQRNNDPVGNSLTTGGPSRLIEDSLVGSAGIRKTTRRGGAIDLSQELGLLNSNSTFFDPEDQGNSRLSLSLAQPLLGRGNQYYNERLLTQARFDSDVSWQQMRAEVETRIVDVVAAYWQLYELRCHLVQSKALLERSREIEALLVARQDFDTGKIELAKTRQRVASRADRVLRLEGEVRKTQSRLALLVGAEELAGAVGSLELIPVNQPMIPEIDVELKTAVQTGLENRPEVKAAASQLESAALSIRVTRTELEPQLNAVFDTYLAGLTGQYNAAEAFTNQFSTGGPGISAGLSYELPRGRRLAKSRYREAHHRYKIRTEELREAVQQTRAEIEVAIVTLQTAAKARHMRREILVAATEEERILTGRWQSMAGDGSNVGVVLETLLDAQQRRVDAERDWVSAQTQYVVSLVQLQQAMGTLLIKSGITPITDNCDNTIRLIADTMSTDDFEVIDQLIQPSPTLNTPVSNSATPNSATPDSAMHNSAVSNSTEAQIGSPNLPVPVHLSEPIEVDVKGLIDTQWLENDAFKRFTDETVVTPSTDDQGLKK